MSEKATLIERAEKSALVLRRLNIITLSVAIVVYIGLLTIAVTESLPPMAVFSTCIMLAEVLVFQLVRTFLVHLALVRHA